MKNLFNTSRNVFFAPDSMGGMGDWERKMERMEKEHESKTTENTNTQEEVVKTQNMENIAQKKSPEQLKKEQEQQKQKEAELRKQKQKELDFAIDAITNLKPGWQTVGGMKKEFEKFGVSLNRIVNIAVREDRKVADVLWVEIKNNPELLKYVGTSEEKFLKEDDKVSHSKIANLFYALKKGEPIISRKNKTDNSEQKEIVQQEEVSVEEKEKENEGPTEFQKFFTSRGIDINLLKQELQGDGDILSGNNTDFSNFESSFSRIIEGGDVTEQDVFSVIGILNKKVNKDVVNNFFNDQRITKDMLKKITLDYLNVKSTIDGGFELEATPENIEKITDEQIEAMKREAMSDYNSAMTFMDFGGLGERAFDGELGKRLYANGEGGSFDQFNRYKDALVSKTWNDGKILKAGETKLDTKGYDVFLMTGYAPGSKEFEKAVQETKEKNNFLGAAKEMAGGKMKNLTSKEKTFRVTPNTSRADLMAELFSGSTLEFPLSSDFAEGRSVKLAFKEGQPTLHFAGHDFDMSGNRESESFIRLFQGMANDPVMMLNLESGDEKGLQPLLKNFEHLYPTEMVGDDPEKFYRTSFDLFADSTGVNWLKFGSDREVRHFMEKLQDPRAVQEMRILLTEKQLINQEGVITGESILKAERVYRENEQTKQDKKDTEQALKELSETSA